MVVLFSSSFCLGQNCAVLTHNPYTDFNSTPNYPAASSIWLHIDTKLANTDLVNNGDYLLFAGGTITLNGISSTPVVTNVPIPNGRIVADNTISIPITSYDMGSNTWTTRVPPGYSSSDIFISGAVITSSTGFKVGAGKSSVVSGSFASNRPSFSDSWFYGIGAYQPPFDYSAIGAPGQVTSIGGGNKAGTPLPEKPFLVAGGSGGGGSNFTGSNSSTDNFKTCQQTTCNLSLSTQQTNATCGATAGSATVTITGGTSPFTYSNSGGVFLQTPNAVSVFNGLAPATYDFTVTDAAGCSANGSVTITASSGVQDVTVTVVRGDFENTCDGEATVNVAGGTGPFTYAWSDGVTTSSNTRDNLCGPPAGSGIPVPYTVVVTDVTGCQGSASFLIDVTSVAPSGMRGSAQSMTGARPGLRPDLNNAVLFPNPSHGVVHLQINSRERGIAVVNLVDMTGRTIKSTVVNLENGTNTKDFLMPVHPGIYMLQIRTSKETRILPVRIN